MSLRAESDTATHRPSHLGRFVPRRPGKTEWGQWMPIVASPAVLLESEEVASSWSGAGWAAADVASRSSAAGDHLDLRPHRVDLPGVGLRRRGDQPGLDGPDGRTLPHDHLQADHLRAPARELG